MILSPSKIRFVIVAVALLVIGLAPPARAADDKTGQQSPSLAKADDLQDDDATINPAEPDYTLISLATSLG